MTAVRVAQLARMIVVFSEEEGGVVTLSGIPVKRLMHGSQEPLRLLPRRRALAAQIRLEIGHQQSGRHALVDDIANHQPKPSIAQIKEVVVVAAHGPRGITKPRVDERSKRGLMLWKRRVCTSLATARSCAA